MGASRARKRAAAPQPDDSSRGHPPQVGGRGGARLAAAFQAVEDFPVLAEARTRLLDAAGHPDAPSDELSSLIESDIGLTLFVLRTANRCSKQTRIGSVPRAVEALGAAGLARAVRDAPGYDFLDAQGPWGPVPERMRRHAVAVRIAAEQIGELTRLPARDELATAALLHDAGRLVLLCLYGEYPRLIEEPDVDPEERLRLERRELGIDHALVGGVLGRKIGLPQHVATAIERHHDPQASGAEAAIGLADLVAHHVQGAPIAPDGLRARAKALGIEPGALRTLLFEYPYAARERPKATEPCPLSARELDALRGLADGKIYKEIAVDMNLSASTVRTHLHNVYRKLGASDRAQAVLIASHQGWI